VVALVEVALGLVLVNLLAVKVVAKVVGALLLTEKPPLTRSQNLVSCS
jgi:hypothetical protein